MRSLRSRLLLGSAVGTIALLSAAGLVVYLLVRARLTAQFDGALAATARSLAYLAEQEHGEIDLEFTELPIEEFRRGERAEYFQVWLPDGTVLARSPSLGQAELHSVAGPLDDPAFAAVVLPDGRRGRTVGVRFHPQVEERRSDADAVSDAPLTLVVARETRDVDDALAYLRLLLVGVGAAAVVLSLAILAGVVRSGLRPVDDLADRIADLGEDDLATRIDVPNAPAELTPVVDRLNELLDRLNQAFAQQKALTADVAHELRTPLAGLQSTLEVALSRERDSAAYRSSMADCLEICRQTQRMVDSLLCLASIDAGQATVHAESVCLQDVLQECWRPLADQARARGLNVDWRVDENLALDTDRDKLRLVLANVLDNAVSYAADGGRIEIAAASPQDGTVEVSVSNTGSSLSDQEIEHVFERFWRADEARAATGVHCGLGLSLCKQLMHLLGGSISAESASEESFRIILAFKTDAEDADHDSASV